MLDPLYLLVALLLILFFAIFIFNFLLYNRFIDKSESNSIALSVFVLTMSACLLCILLIPLDVFISSSYEGKEAVNKVSGVIGIKLDIGYFPKVMMLSYFVCILFMFVLIPFAYFYTEDKINSEDSLNLFALNWQDKNHSSVCTSIKYTSFFVIFIGILLTCGLYFRNNPLTKRMSPSMTKMTQNEKTKEESSLAWIKKLYDYDNFGESAISFCVSLFAVIGMLFLIIYTGYGLSSLPFYLIKGKKSLLNEQDRLDENREKTRDKIKNIQTKMGRKGNLSSKDKKELFKLKEEEQYISKQISRITDILENENIFNKILKFLTPFRVIIGIFCLLLSLLIFFSLFTTSIDKYLNSKCGFSCGFVIDKPRYQNYVNQLLLFSSKYFYLDHILFTIISLYIYISTIYGICTLGIKLLCITLYEIKKSYTIPQAMLIFGFLISLMVLSMVMEMMTLAPQYLTFGLQKNSKGNECTIKDIGSNKCIMTNTAMFYNKISISLPFFSAIFYFANWALILMLGIGMIISMLQEENDFPFDEHGDFEDEEKLILNEEL
ncbi:MAG: LMBR1 domain-containing protein [archaeon]|nr:LMBR1 domain-containing protein [archaeon]